jgi:hypothetical protein
MKKLVSALLLLALAPGCSMLLPQGNEPPKAYIDGVTPGEAVEGETVRFIGHGTDADGQVVGYRWRSDKDGQFGTAAEVETSSLSAGSHSIYFSVQDNSDVWSAETRASVTISAPQAAPPRVDLFDSSAVSVSAGASVTLSWKVANAASVSIDQGIGLVAPEGSIAVTPATTATYTLTATGGGAIATAALTIAVVDTGREVALEADIELTGFVRSLGIYVPGAVYVGDDSSDRGIQGFFTFDISRIPDDATVTRVTIDMSDYEVPHGAPLPELGCLTAYVHKYSTLYGQYRTGDDLPSPIGEWCEVDDLDEPWESSQLQDAVQSRVGESRFQFRLQFAEGETDGDHGNDMLYWPEQGLPTLIVEYFT